MQNTIAYGVFWVHKRNPDEWSAFSCWHTTCESASLAYAAVKRNPDCLKRKIVKRTEAFEDVCVD